MTLTKVLPEGPGHIPYVTVGSLGELPEGDCTGFGDITKVLPEGPGQFPMSLLGPSGNYLRRLHRVR